MTHTVAHDTMNKSHQMQRRNVKTFSIHDNLGVLSTSSRVTKESFVEWMKSDLTRTQGNYTCLPNDSCVIFSIMVPHDWIVLEVVVKRGVVVLLTNAYNAYN